MPSPGQERERLAETYAAMSDDELEALAESAESLTDVARLTLSEEMARRGLDFVETRSAADEAPESVQPDTQTLVPIFHTIEYPEVAIVKGLLESNGIKVTTQSSIAPVEAGIGVGPVRLLVPADQAEEAQRIIEESELDLPEEEE